MDGTSVKVENGELWCVDSGGSGEAIIFLHANTGTSESFDVQLRFFAEAGYRAIAFDRRGSGRSTAANQTGPTRADDIDALLDALHLEVAHLVAVAGGAFGAFDYAAWQPQRVKSLVIGATIGPYDEDEIRSYVERIRIEVLRGPDRVAELEVSPGYRGEHPEGTAHWMEIASRARVHGAPDQPLKSKNTYAKFQTITAPVLVLAGGADLIAPPALMRRWAAQLPNATFVVLPELGHSVAWEDPDEFNARALEFISGHR